MRVEDTAIRTKLQNALLRKTPITKMEAVSELLERFQQEAVPLIANMVQNEQEVELAVEIVVGKLEFKTRRLTYGEVSDLMGYSRSAYDHHGYPTAYDLDEEAGVLSPLLEGVEVKEALILLNNPEGFRRLLDQRLAISSQGGSQEKPSCPKCKGSEFLFIGRDSVTDHHQINYMASYLKFKCRICGHEWEEDET